MKILLPVLIMFLFSCNSKRQPEVNRTYQTDPDIVLINIGNADRAGIADLLMKIDKCKPLLIGIDIIFADHKDPFGDSLLVSAIQTIKNDILAYRVHSTDSQYRSTDEIRKFAGDEGFIDLDVVDGMSSYFTPVQQEGNITHESFALKIIRRWKPGFKYKINPNESIPIRFQRGQHQFHCFAEADLPDKEIEALLENKVVIVGFLGPGNEDKHFTPLARAESLKKDQPDTYGLVIQANAIRTILEANK